MICYSEQGRPLVSVGLFYEVLVVMGFYSGEILLVKL